MQDSKTTIYLVLIFIVCSFSSWFYLAGHRHAAPAPITDSTIDIYGHDVSSVNFDEQGQLAMSLHATEFVHYPKQKKTLFVKPTLLFHKENQSAWRMTSGSVQIPDDRQELTFENDVLLKQLNGDTLIRTSLLRYFPQQHIASSTAATLIQQPGALLHSQGFSVNLKTEQIHLAHAQGHYAQHS